LTSQQLKAALAKHSITPVESVGQQFDPNVHEALGSEPTDAMPPGHVTKVFKKPYKYADKLLRHGQVIVAKAKE
jgi:molecular chaperone GrpE